MPYYYKVSKSTQWLSQQGGNLTGINALNELLFILFGCFFLTQTCQVSVISIFGRLLNPYHRKVELKRVTFFVLNLKPQFRLFLRMRHPFFIYPSRCPAELQLRYTQVRKLVLAW